jgi:tellurite resistance protein
MQISFVNVAVAVAKAVGQFDFDPPSLKLWIAVVMNIRMLNG